jgi:RNA-directed DNA polymerase
VGQAQADSRAGETWVGDRDLEQCCDRVHHAGLRSRGRQRVQDRRGGSWSPRFRQAGGLTLEGSIAPTAEGTPPGGPLSPLRANLLLDERDKELEPRGQRFVRSADAAHSYGRRRQAGERVRARVPRFLTRQLRRTVNAAKSAVDRPWNRTCRGCTFTTRPCNRRTVREQALKTFQAKGRGLTGRPRGRPMQPIGQALRQRMLGGRAFFGVAEVRAPRRDLAKWRRRRLRRDHGQPWGRRGYRARRQRGVGRQLAWNTAKSAPGPWRLRQRPALAIARPQRDCAARGLPSLVEGGRSHDRPRTAGYVTRMSGGVGGREPRGSPLSRLSR